MLPTTPSYLELIAASVSSREKIPRGLGIAAYWCGFMNSAINPYLIGLRSEKFYDAFVAVFCCRFHSCKCNSNERKNESTNPNDQMLCTDGKRESPLEQTLQMAHVGDDYANSFLNMAAVSDTNATQETSAKITNDEKTRHQRRQGRDETPGVIYPCYIHMVDGKLWNEAIV